MKKLLYALVVLIPIMLIGASSPEIRNFSATYRVYASRGDTTYGTYRSLATVSAMADTVMIATIDCSKWDRLYIRGIVHETYQSGTDTMGGTVDSNDAMGLGMFVVRNYFGAVDEYGKPVSAPSDSVNLTIDYDPQGEYSYGFLYYNIGRDTTRFVPEIQLYAYGIGASEFVFRNPIDSTMYDTAGVFVGDSDDTLTVIRYDFEFTTIKK